MCCWKENISKNSFNRIYALSSNSLNKYKTRKIPWTVLKIRRFRIRDFMCWAFYRFTICFSWYVCYCDLNSHLFIRFGKLLNSQTCTIIQVFVISYLLFWPAMMSIISDNFLVVYKILNLASLLQLCTAPPQKNAAWCWTKKQHCPQVW